MSSSPNDPLPTKLLKETIDAIAFLIWFLTVPSKIMDTVLPSLSNNANPLAKNLGVTFDILLGEGGGGGLILIFFSDTFLSVFFHLKSTLCLHE